MSGRKNFGRAGHLIVSDSCRFHLHTHVGKFCVSTVGDYRVNRDDARMTEVGYKRMYETMVFNTKSKAARWQELEMAGYGNEAAAEKGHEEMVAKYEAMSR